MVNAIEFQSVTLRRGKALALAGLDLAIPEGSLTVVLGPNGAGKSTLLKAVTGELRPSEGRILVLGQEISALNWRESARLRRRIGVMPQLPEQVPAAPVSARDLVEMSRAADCPARRNLDAHDSERCEHWLHRFGLSAHSERPYYSLSGGEQRKAQLARIFAQEPELILLDEPAGHLDLPSQDDLIRVISEVWKETGSTILIVTHDLRQMPPDCSHVVLLRNGRLLTFGTPDATLTDSHLSSLYDESISVVKHAGRFLAVGTGRKEAAHG